MKRYPYLTGLVLVIAEILCFCWMLTHAGCAHPLGNGVAAVMAFLIIPLGFLALLERDK